MTFIKNKEAYMLALTYMRCDYEVIARLYLRKAYGM